MSKRKKSIIIKEFWSNYSFIISVVLSMLPFLILISARGFLLPLVLVILFLVGSAVVCMLYAVNTAEIIIDKENKEIMKALRGVK